MIKSRAFKLYEEMLCVMDAVGSVIIGIAISILGIVNMKGNISSIHWYHRRRVSEEDRLPYGKLVGAGTLIIGISLVLMGCCFFLAEFMDADVCNMIGSVLVVIGLVAGLGLSGYAMIKYNNGIF